MDQPAGRHAEVVQQVRWTARITLAYLIDIDGIFPRPVLSDFETGKEPSQRLLVLGSVGPNPQGRFEGQGALDHGSLQGVLQGRECTVGFQRVGARGQVQQRQKLLEQCGRLIGKILPQAQEEAGFFHGVEPATAEVVVQRQEHGLMIGEFGRTVDQRRHARVSGLLTGQQAFGATHDLQGGLVRQLAQMQGGEHANLGYGTLQRVHLRTIGHDKRAIIESDVGQWNVAEDGCHTPAHEVSKTWDSSVHCCL